LPPAGVAWGVISANFRFHAKSDAVKKAQLSKENPD
jgi:hypothetical protein